MFISEVTYQKLIGPARLKYKPWLPSLENQVENLFNHTPGILFLSYNVKVVGRDDEFKVIDIRLACTKAGIINYMEIFNKLKKSVNEQNSLSCNFIITSRGLPEGFVKSKEKSSVLKHTYFVFHNTQQEYVDKKYDYLYRLKCALIETSEEINHVHI
jgi:hypothetical protein